MTVPGASRNVRDPAGEETRLGCDFQYALSPLCVVRQADLGILSTWYWWDRRGKQDATLGLEWLRIWWRKQDGRMIEVECGKCKRHPTRESGRGQDSSRLGEQRWLRRSSPWMRGKGVLGNGCHTCSGSKPCGVSRARLQLGCRAHLGGPYARAVALGSFVFCLRDSVATQLKLILAVSEHRVCVQSLLFLSFFF